MNHLQDLEARGEIDFTRQRDFFDPTKVQTDVVICGCGGIGSPTALLLAKMGLPRIRLIDPDIVESHNLPNQLFKLNSMDHSKVGAVKQLLEETTYCEVEVNNARAEEVPENLRGIVITALDSMEARQAMWEVIKLNPMIEYLIDMRMGAFQIVITCLKPMDIDHCAMYEEHMLFSDEEAEEAPCTGRAIMDVGFQAAAQTGRLVRTILNGHTVPNVVSFNQQNLGKSEFTWSLMKQTMSAASSQQDAWGLPEIQS